MAPTALLILLFTLTGVAHPADDPVSRRIAELREMPADELRPFLVESFDIFVERTPGDRLRVHAGRSGLPDAGSVACRSADSRVRFAEGSFITARCAGVDVEARLRDVAGRVEALLEEAAPTDVGDSTARRLFDDALRREGLVDDLVDAWHRRLSTPGDCVRAGVRAALEARQRLSLRFDCDRTSWESILGVCNSTDTSLSSHVVLRSNVYLPEAQRQVLRDVGTPGLSVCLVDILEQRASADLRDRLRRLRFSTPSEERSRIEQEVWSVWAEAGVPEWLDRHGATGARPAECR